LGVRRWRELVIGTNGEVLFDKPKPTAGCSANGRIRRTLNTETSIKLKKIGHVMSKLSVKLG
jgi:hypothetical protein